MKYFNWNSEKNKKLIKEREVSFEICLIKIESGNILDILNNKNYPNQKNICFGNRKICLSGSFR